MNKWTVLLLGLLASGCTQTVVTTEHWSIKRISVLQRAEIPSVIIATNGQAELHGYKTDGGAEVIGTAVGTAVTTYLKTKGL